MESDLFNLAKNLADTEKEKRDEIDLLEQSKIYSFDAIKKFCSFLNINPEIFKHVFNIDMKIEKIYGKYDAQYFHHDDYISVNSNYLKNNIDMIKENDNLKYKLLPNIERVLIHEMIHAKRRETLLCNESLEENSKNVGIEEILTDAIAILIVSSSINGKIDIEYFKLKMINDKESDAEDVLGANLIAEMGEDLVSWFLTSQNYGFLKEKLGDNYTDLVNCAFNIYISEYNNKAVDDNDFINANKIIKH